MSVFAYFCLVVMKHWNISRDNFLSTTNNQGRRNKFCLRGSETFGADLGPKNLLLEADSGPELRPELHPELRTTQITPRNFGAGQNSRGDPTGPPRFRHPCNVKHQFQKKGKRSKEDLDFGSTWKCNISTQIAWKSAFNIYPKYNGLRMLPK